MEHFNGSRLAVARRRRGFTKKELAELIGVDPRSISAFESGEIAPRKVNIERLSIELGFPRGFYFGADLDVPSEETASFRSMARMSARKRHAALAAGTIAFILSDWIEKRFHLPDSNLINFRNSPPEIAAMELRQHWGIGEKPISNIVNLLEINGIRIFSLAENCEEVDAFSLWKNDRPFVFLNTKKTAEHSRFDAAHELGHLVLHKHGAPNGQEAESQANTFASAFLMPLGDVTATVSAIYSLNDLIALKKRWIVSVAALAYRLHKIGILSDWRYRALFIEISQKGYRKLEPEGSQREVSQVWDKVFSSLRSEGTTKQDVAQKLMLPEEEIEKLIFGLVLMGINGARNSKRKVRSKTPALRLVK